MAITRATNLAGLGTVFDGGGLNISGVTTFNSFVGIGTTSGQSPMISVGGTIRAYSPLTGFGATSVTFIGIYPDADTPRIHFEENGIHRMELAYRGNNSPTRQNIGELKTVGLQPLSFLTNSNERVRITSDGDVGIGLTNPAAALHISRSIAEIRLTDSDGDGDYSQIISGATGNLFLCADAGNGGSNSRISLLVDNDEKVRITSSGDVGIGTDNPQANLHVVRSTSGTALKLNNTLGDAQSYVDLDFDTYSVDLVGYANAPATIRVQDDGSYSGHICFRTKGDSIGASQSEKVRITSDGFIGVGTDNPSHELHIRGSSDTRALITSGGSGDAVMMFENASGNTWGHGIDLTNNNYVVAYYASGDPSLTSHGKLEVTTAGDVQVVNGDLVFSTSGTGIDFSATSDAGGMTSELLNDYEEGTWTPADTSTGITFSSSDGRYRKVGSIVVAYGNVQFPVNSNGLSVGISLPFTAGGGRPGGFIRYTNSSLYFSMHVNAGAAIVVPYLNTGSAVANSQMSNKRLDFEVIYSTT